jgi:hypothetical protein
MGQSPGTEKIVCSILAEELIAAIEHHPWRDLLQAPPNAVNLGGSNIGECGESMTVERRQCNLVEIDQTNLGYAGTSQRCNGMGSDTTAADNDNVRSSELCEAFVCEEYTVPSKLF